MITQLNFADTKYRRVCGNDTIEYAITLAPSGNWEVAYTREINTHRPRYYSCDSASTQDKAKTLARHYFNSSAF